MARTHLTLAALVSSAMDGFSPAASRDYASEIHDDVDAAVIEDHSGVSIVVEVPRTGSADAELRAEARAIEAITAGVRSVLPFEVPSKLQQAKLGDGIALISSFVPGIPLTSAMLRGRASLCVSIGQATAAIHELPTSVVTGAGLPSMSAMDARLQIREVVARARQTNMLPAPLALRWEAAIDSDGLWQFEPVVVHGSFTADALLVQGDAVSGVIGWHALRVGDPARDLNWLVNADDDARTGVYDAYAGIRLQSVDPNLMQRANLYNEIDVARWLLHGIDKKSPAIVDDAIAMLDQLVTIVAADQGENIVDPETEVLDVNQVEDLLDETPVYRPLGTIND